LHGVFMEVFAVGVLITGRAGAGKSGLALELLDRGHRLVADDVVELERDEHGIVLGSCPPLLKDFMAVRDLGVLDVRQIFGDGALAEATRLGLMLELLEDGWSGDALEGTRSRRTILGREFPVVALPARAGNRLALLAEAAVRDVELRRAGYDAPAALAARQARWLRRRREP
jgi:HPr kinase/phosphorylase